MDDCRKQITALIQNFADSTIFCGGTIVAGTKVDFVVNHLLANNVAVQKHGRWIKDGDVVVCSECGEEHAWDEYRATYCEDCGAKMDGGNDNG